MRNRNWLIALGAIILLFNINAALAENPSEFENANRLYDQGKFSEAKKAYEVLLNAHNYSANLFYNLGNTDYRLGDLPGAILAYERALVLSPAHSEALANLKLVRNKTGAKVEGYGWSDFVFPEFRENVLVTAAAAAAWSAVFALAMLCFRRRRQNTPFWLWAVASVAIAAYASLAVRQLEKKKAVAIVTSKLVEARFAPEHGAAPLESLPAGSRVRVLSGHGEWSYCALPGKSRGWLPTREIERIQPSS